MKEKRKIFLIAAILICIMLISACGDYLNDKDPTIGDIEGIESSNLDWLIGKWSSGDGVSFTHVAEIKKIDDVYYIKVSLMYNDRFSLAETEDLILTFDELTGKAYYGEDTGGNEGNVYVYLDNMEKSLSMRVKEAYSNSSILEKVTTYDSIVAMSAYKERVVQEYKYYDGPDEYYDLLDFLRANIWISTKDPSIEWAFVPSRISVDHIYLYENGKIINTFFIDDRSGVNQLEFTFREKSSQEWHRGNIRFVDGLMEIIFEGEEEILVFK